MKSKISLSLVLVIICFDCLNNQIIELPFDKIIANDSPTYNYKLNLVQNLQFPLIINDNSCYLIRVQIGSEEQGMKLKLTTTRSGLFLMSNLDLERDFRYRESISYKLIKEKNINNEPGIIITDTLKISKTDITINNYYMFLIEDKSVLSNYYEGFLGFGLVDNNSSNKLKDLASVLFEQNLIVFQKISMTHLSNDSGVLTIGDLPSEISENKKKYKTCSIGNEKEWKCLLKSIYFEDGTIFPIDSQLNIALGGNIFHVDKGFFDFFINKYFDNDITQGRCRVSMQGGFDTLCCQKEYNTNNLFNLSLVIGKWNIKLKIKDLFYDFDEDYTEKMCLFIVQKSNEWFISPSIMKKYTVVLDKDGYKIGFYKGN